VVRARKPGKLLVEVIALDVGGSTAATVKIETLTQGETTAAAASPQISSDLRNSLGGLRLLGHVAGIGDVQSESDEWIAGPEAPARIEGFAIEWLDKPADLALHYSARLARPHEMSGRMTAVGDYAGTRGRALPIVGIALELSGAAATRFQLSVEAAFLSAPLQRSSGRQLDMSGPTGREPLVGLRLRVEEINIPLQPAQRPISKLKKPSGRVRVFRSRNAQSELRSALQSFCAAAV
jgi:hypothetical protein